MGEAGRPGVQRRSEITAAATGVGGLALWRGHPARRCRPSSVHRAAGAPYWSVSFIAITSVRPCLLRTRETGWRGGEAPNLPSRLADGMTHILGNCIRRLACAHQYVIYVHAIRYVGRTAERTAVDIKAHTPLIRFVVDLLYNKLWTCRGFVVDLLVELVFVQNGEHRRFG